MEMENLSILEAKKLIDNGELSPLDLTNYYLNRIEDENPRVNAFITVNKDAPKQADNYIKGKKLSGIPIAVKDVFSTKDLKTTCASHIIDNYYPAYESTVTSRMLNEGAIFIGKTNLDEFCHGSSTETSYFGPSRNPHDEQRLAGGSSGGSATAVADDLCAGSVGTETAGSIRQPSSWCGCIGLKPTYGRVPRYGVVAMGSSLDSPGPIVKTVDDAAYLLSIIGGFDQKDMTSSKLPVPDYLNDIDKNCVKGIKIGIPKEFLKLDLEKDVRKNFEEKIAELKSAGAIISEIELLAPKYAMAVYTVICRSEVSSNLSRFDGTRYCNPSGEEYQVSDYFQNVRGNGFGSEAKRRIMTGTFSLSAGYSDEFFKKADKVREIMKDNFKDVFKEVDLIAGPTTPNISLKVGSTKDNPLFGEMMDILAENSSLAGLPAITVPSGISNNLPTGLQLIGNYFDEQRIINIAKILHN